MARSIAGIVGGIAIAVLTVFCLEWIGHQFYPPPAGIDPADPESLRRAMEAVPAGAKVAVVAAWLLGTLAGGYAATRIAVRYGRRGSSQASSSSQRSLIWQ